MKCSIKCPIVPNLIRLNLNVSTVVLLMLKDLDRYFVTMHQLFFKLSSGIGARVSDCNITNHAWSLIRIMNDIMSIDQESY